MRREDRIRVKAEVEKIRNKPVPQQTESEVSFCTRKQFIIPDAEEGTET